MTLNELVQKLRNPPEVGTHEIVRTSDGMNHIAVIVLCRDIVDKNKRVREFGFQLICGRSDVKADVEVVRDGSVTCLPCVQWKTH